MKILEYPPKENWKALTIRPQMELEFLEGAVKNILNRVRISGDAALLELTEQYDQVKISNLQVTENEKAEGERNTTPELRDAIKTAVGNIERFHAAQSRGIVKVETMPGVCCWRKEIAIGKIGIYIPGGTAPLFSTVLMLGIPARLAGCKNITLCTPPEKDGRINAAILYAAQVAGITTIFKVGGAQAIAAMAYGTQSIPAVDKIYGPGNQYVTKAKQLINQLGIAIDMPAGPSEVLVIADEHANPAFVAADLLSQAEHGPDSQVVLATQSKAMVSKIIDEIDKQVEFLPRKEVALQALSNSLALLFSAESTLVDFVNEYAPEHLIINTKNCDELAEKIENAGSVFLGPLTPESAGDYASGTNHTLPTNGLAKSYSGVSLESFMKCITFQKINEQGMKNLGPVVEIMALAENLKGHQESISIRLKSLK
jgi:histidinol dehydrogenase